jgi:Thiamine pyrophosphate-requiring enzymes [acetolactate synthase, pyruvate dehydrogenase (cytochrome), glyoxylate carboligase, phosphonopyruvate decarboxylase]
MAKAKRPLFYCGGGIVNSGPAASKLLGQLIHLTGFPCTLTLMGLGAFPASDPQYLGMVGMHGLYESNMAMHDCDVMINVGARFDDRVTGKLAAFSPNSRRSTSTSTAPRSTRTCASTCPSSAIAGACSRT